MCAIRKPQLYMGHFCIISSLWNHLVIDVLSHIKGLALPGPDSTGGILVSLLGIVPLTFIPASPFVQRS